MAKDVNSINLIPNKNGGLVDQFLAWALTIGRLLIILTETLALSIFLYRFSIDMKIVDLNDEIKKQSIIAKQFENVENTSRNLQSRIALAKDINSHANKTTDIFADLIDMGQGQITFNNIIVTDKTIKTQVQARQASRLSHFINKLRSHPSVKSVNINSIENKISNALIIANISATLEGNDEETLDFVTNTLTP